MSFIYSPEQYLNSIFLQIKEGILTEADTLSLFRNIYISKVENTVPQKGNAAILS